MYEETRIFFKKDQHFYCGHCGDRIDVGGRESFYLLNYEGALQLRHNDCIPEDFKKD